MKHLVDARARVIKACDGIDASLTERSWIDPDDVRILLGAFTREDVLDTIAATGHLNSSFPEFCVRLRNLADRIEAILPPEPK